jgi:hypothetical protein
MTKHGLGRGLDRLMNGDAVAGRSSAPGPAAKQPPAPAAPKPQAGRPAPAIGKGLGTLLDAPKPFERADAAAKPWQRSASAAAPSTAARKELLPAWFFFAVDILLLAFCVAITFDAPKPLDTGHVLFCSITIGLGTVLGVAGVLKSR